MAIAARWVAAVAVSATLAPGCGGGEGGRLPEGGASFEVSVRFTYEPIDGCPPWVPPAIERFAIRLVPVGTDIVRLLARRGGGIEAADLVVDAGDPFLLHGSVRIGVGSAEAWACETTWPYEFETLDLRLLDRDGDAVADALSGAAAGRVQHQRSDVSCHWSFAAGIEGEPDRQPPIVAPESVDGPQHPLDGFAFVADEPLPPDLVATLTANGEPFATLMSAPQDLPEARIEYYLSDADWPPPFGAELAVRFSPWLADLAGNAAASATVPGFATIADPGFLAEDGFEGPVAAYLRDTAQVVEGYGDLPAIAGSRSLQILPDGAHTFRGGRFTARLRLDPGDHAIAFRYRFLIDSFGSDDRFWGVLRVALPGTHVVFYRDLPEVATTDLVPTGLRPWDQASVVADMVILLPPDPGPEAWLDLQLADRACGGRYLLGEESAILLDDVRTE